MARYYGSIVCCLLLLLFVCELNCQIVFGCQKDYCARQPNSCPDLKCDNGRIVKNATKCGCCHICVDKLDQDALCLDQLTATVPRQECGPGLECLDKTCKPGDNTCTKKLAEFEKNVDGQEITTGKPKPKCDPFGYFEPVQCKPGMLCHCVDREGNPIFGSAPYTAENEINCLCSRTLIELQELKVFQGEDVQYLKCTAEGDYDEPQCTESQCYCINKTGDTLSLPIENRNGSLIALPCYTRSKHSANYDTPCWKERAKVKAQIRNATDQGITILGLEAPTCDPDGSYAPKQCKEDVCYCVNKKGVRYYDNVGPKYTVARYSEYAKIMRCNCEREKELLRHIVDNKVTEIFANYKCDVNGNYLPMQCTTSVCYCVDAYGYQTSGIPAVVVVDRKELKCYNTNFDTILGILD